MILLTLILLEWFENSKSREGLSICVYHTCITQLESEYRLILRDGRICIDLFEHLVFPKTLRHRKLGSAQLMTLLITFLNWEGPYPVSNCVTVSSPILISHRKNMVLIGVYIDFWC